MNNKTNTINIVSKKYISFELLYKRKILALLNIDEEECTLYDIREDAFLNPYLKGFVNKKLKLSLVKDAGKWQIVSNREIFINGVAWRKRVLKDGDKIYLGEYRLVFQGNFIEDLHPDPLPCKHVKSKRILRVLEAAAVILSVSFLWYCTTINHNAEVNVISNELADIEHESELPHNYAEEFDDVEDLPSINTSDELENDYSLRMYAPGEELSPQKLDILFIHAHPDDESLDYGLYMSEASNAGKSVGIIVFTDGDSGFDKYPDRPIDGFYPDAELRVPNLAKVRVQEAEKALTVLGAEVYVRMGLWNRPYTAEEVNKSLNTLLEEWGGRDFLIEKLVDYIEIFQPDVIVSPDGPCGAREHFEHEAVGFLSEMAVNVYRKRDPGKLKAYLKLVDVQQIEAYNGISLVGIDASENNKYKEIKRAALMMHQTQADASYFGIKRLKHFPVEYYMVRYGSLNNENLTL
ncbi:MAG: PIG-L family deacetylase, partial [Spirochaetota bacterium]|nr:PIG-L family deacetylase [Spirochaetota bacterium]